MSFPSNTNIFFVPSLSVISACSLSGRTTAILLTPPNSILSPFPWRASYSTSAVKLKLPALERNSSDSTRSDIDSGSIFGASFTSTPSSVCEYTGKTKTTKTIKEPSNIPNTVFFITHPHNLFLLNTCQFTYPPASNTRGISLPRLIRSFRSLTLFYLFPFPGLLMQQTVESQGVPGQNAHQSRYTKSNPWRCGNFYKTDISKPVKDLTGVIYRLFVIRVERVECERRNRPAQEIRDEENPYIGHHRYSHHC